MESKFLSKPVVLHARLKRDGVKIDNYQKATTDLLNLFEDLLNPKTLLIPTFTYSFTKSGVFHRQFSKSETGRFSEELRLESPKNRTKDPIFSFIDSKDYFKELDYDYSKAFGLGSFLDLLSKQDFVVANYNLDELVTTHLHYIESKYSVPYRFVKFFKGVILDNQQEEATNYEYLVRRLDVDTTWNRAKIKDDLLKADILKKNNVDGVNVYVYLASEADFFWKEKIKENPDYLIEKV